MENNRGFLCFCLGCAVGGAAAVLLAPHSRKAANYLGRKADEGTDYVKQRVDDARDAVTGVRDAVTGAVANGKRAVRYQAENLRAAVDAGERAYKAAQEATP